MGDSRGTESECLTSLIPWKTRDQECWTFYLGAFRGEVRKTNYCCARAFVYDREREQSNSRWFDHIDEALEWASAEAIRMRV